MATREKIMVDQSIIKFVTPKKVLEAHLLNKPDKVITRISPSQLGKCHRSHYYKIKQIERLIRNSPSELANFELGFIWEQIIKQALDEQNVPYTFQDRFVDIELNMEGSSDFIIGDPKVEAYMYDPKTMMSKWFWYLEAKKKKGQYDPYTEHYSYFIQQGAYLLMAKRKGWIIPDSNLVFISKDDSIIGAEVEIKLTAKLEKEVLKRVKDLNHYLEHDILPPCTCDGWLVGYCDYGNPNTMKPNSKGRMASTECCPDEETLEVWRTEAQKNAGTK
ncbi:MAG: hypothetical protein ACOH18_05465 [Candidatus Saccharimonadaceae bacterium]